MIIVTSLAFKNKEPIPKKYACDGENFSPPFQLVGVPHVAKSIALIVEDPDAPNGTFTHWIVYNINPRTTRIEQNKTPEGALLAANDFQVREYRGPCPPSGTHRYFFKFYALDTRLSVPEGATRQAVEHTMRGHILDRGEIMGTYTKSS